MVLMIRHELVVLRDEGALTPINFGQGVDVLQLGSTEVSLIPSSTASASSTAVPSSSTVSSPSTSSSTTTVLRKRGVFTGELGLNTLAVGCVADRREDGPDGFDELPRALTSDSVRHSQVMQERRRSSAREEGKNTVA